uniref:Putative extracellular protein TR9_042 n=1 Tax=Trebouxia lynnae TaxID=1825957 RepID=A0A7L9QEJ5_9CHLO|nr:putative extracellular protein TR9_042 [Trebouxia lynnae]
MQIYLRSPTRQFHMELLRPFVATVLCLLFAAGLAVGQPAVTNCQAGQGFLHGVASGDPTATSVILWTKFSSRTPTQPTDLTWYISTSNDLSDATSRTSGTVSANGTTDFTVKVDVTSLQADTRYYFAFASGNYSSQLGTTKTLPAMGGPRRQIRLAQQSCVNWRFGFWHVYNMTAQILDIDALVFLGDIIYEYGDDTYPTTDAPPFHRAVDASVRGSVQPSHECVNLSDYRLRHSHAKTDAALQEMQRRVPLIAIWDDHDVANNAWKGGAKNTAKGVTWSERMAAGVQAWHEYVPIRSAGPTEADRLKIYRSFNFGSIATLAVVEGRFAFRTQQYNYTQDPYIQALENNPPDSWDTLPNLAQLRSNYYEALAAPDRTIIGSQVQNLSDDFAASTAANIPWQLFGNGVIVSPRRTPDVEQAIQELYGATASAILGGLLSVSTGKLASVINGLGSSARVLVGTGRFNDTIITDGWDGYVSDREKLHQIFRNSANPVVLAGDSHNAWAYNVIDPNTSLPLAVEFDDPSVTPPGLDALTQLLPGNVLDILQRGMYISNPGLQHSELAHRGTIIHTITQQNLHADYYYANNVYDTTLSRFCGAAFDVKPGAHTLQTSQCTTENQLFFQLGSTADPLMGFSLDQAALTGTALYDCQNTQNNTEGSSPEQGIISDVTDVFG